MSCNRFFLFFIGGMIFMAINFFGCTVQKFEKYSSRDTELNITIDFFSGWNFNEDRGAYGSYAQVIFLEPVHKGKSPRSSVVFTTFKESTVKFQPLTLEGFFDDQRKKWLTRKEAKLLLQEKAKVTGFPAYCAELTYQELANPESGAANFVLMQERIYLWEKDNKFYTLRYINAIKEFSKFKKAFIHCVNSIKFKDAK